MTVLFSELQVPGWAQTGEKIGLNDVTYTFDDTNSQTLPCHVADPELFFSEQPAVIAQAKALCGSCPMKAKCLQGALSRAEPVGVWGRELFDEGQVIQSKRSPGRPAKVAQAS